MKKFIILLSIFFLIFFTTVTKNSTKEIERQIYDIRENIRVLKNRHEMALLDFNYLSSPEKLLEYQSKYFENDLIFIDIDKIKKIKAENDELIIIESNKIKLTNE